MTDLFAAAAAFTLGREKGFVDDPQDSGGPTNRGVTLSDLAQWRGRPVSIEELKALSPAEAQSFYRARYWETLACGRINSLPTAIVLFDAGIAFGLFTSAVSAQKALRDCEFKDLKVDGHLGPESLKALNAAAFGAFVKPFQASLDARVDFVVGRWPKDAKFAGGWKNRIALYSTLEPIN